MMRDEDLAIESGMVGETYRQGVYGYGADVAVSCSFLQKPDDVSPQSESLPNYRQLRGPWWKLGPGDRGIGRVDLVGTRCSWLRSDPGSVSIQYLTEGISG